MTEIKMVNKTERFTVDDFSLKVGDIFASDSGLFVFTQVERDGFTSHDLIELNAGLGVPNNSLDMTYAEGRELTSSVSHKSIWESAIAERLINGELREVEKVEVEYIEK